VIGCCAMYEVFANHPSDVFLKSVFAVFDKGNNQIGFAQQK